MHENTLHNQRKSIRFRRWSRKNYAVFGSLHRHVTIGRVCKGIADSSLDKARHIVSVEGNGQCVYVAVEPAGSEVACIRKTQNNCHLPKRNGERIRVASCCRCARVLSPFRFFMPINIYDRNIRKKS